MRLEIPNLIRKTLKPLFPPKQDPYQCIPLDHPMVNRAKEIIPREWWGNTWVAGSAATRFGQHGDVDVWITGIPRNISPTTILPDFRWGAEVDMDEDYEHIAIKLYNNPEEKLQIMGCHDDIHRLLSSFDISVHCGAMHIITGEQLRGTGYSERLKIVNFIQDKPILTLTRYLTFAKRYKDYGAVFEENVQKCAADTFYLKTPAQTEQMLKDNFIDRGL